MGLLSDMVRASTGAELPPSTPIDPLDRAQFGLADAGKHLANLRQRRDALLLADDDAGAVKLAEEIALAERTLAAQEDKVRLRTEERERQEAERRAVEHQARIERVEAKLAERDVVGDEIEAWVGQGEKLFRRLIALSTEARAEWPFAMTDVGVGLLSGHTLSIALTHEIFRQGTHPALGGTPGETVQVPLPGGKAPKIELTGRPDKVTPFGEVLRQSSTYLSGLLRGRKGEVPASASGIAVAASAITALAPGLAERTDAQQRLAGLLAEMSRAANAGDDTRYAEIVAQVAAAQGEVNAEGAHP